MVQLDGHTLSIEEVTRVARNGEKIQLSAKAIAAVKKSHQRLITIIKQKKPVYGINTGFGIFCSKNITIEENKELNRNLILSHAVGVGPFLAPEIVKAAMLVRANTLAKGYSGVRPIVIETLIAMINQDLIPMVKSQGSLGSSGDLCMLAEMALVFSKGITDAEEESGLALFKGHQYSGKEAMREAGIQRVEFGPKEGLATINGATFSAALAALCLWEASTLCAIADTALSLSLEALLGRSEAFDERLQKVRGLSGQQEVAEHVRKLIKDSTFINSSPHIQDAYSLRCGPQVHGAVRDTLNFVSNIIRKEINAATDNPLIFEKYDVLSGGNFHGEPIALFMDYLSIAISELASISERRIFRLLDENLNQDLPPMLVDDSQKIGLKSGLMIPHYTASSLVLENKILASPDSIHSLPTSANQEDHNANAWTAVKHTHQIIENSFRVLAIELYTAVYAINIRLKKNADKKLGFGTQVAFDKIRSLVPYKPGDILWEKEIELLYQGLKQPDMILQGLIE
ncbi:MAG TPA: aromatic amino acid lyase [Anaerolineae bacterium]|nr:aromatic amino acid lyase [Anaerolineae bacterium]